MRFLYLIWSGYALYILHTVYTYFKGKHLVSDMSIYNAWFLKKLGLAVAILAVSFALKQIGKITLAKWVAGVPAVVVGGMLLLGVLAWLFTWFSFWLGSK
ncbi:MAG TPA: hypothetical protein VGK46_05430 [Saprospiraceae bacterium]